MLRNVNEEYVRLWLWQEGGRWMVDGGWWKVARQQFSNLTYSGKKA
jgi:hypothetical protein